MYIQKQANGTYRVWVRRRGRSTSSTFDRKADAEAFGRRIEAAIEAGASVEYQKIKSATLADLLRLYETNVIPERRRPTQEKQRIGHWLRVGRLSASSSSHTATRSRVIWFNGRSEERRVGKECVSTCRSRRSQNH